MTVLVLDTDAALKARGEELAAEARAQGVFLCPVCIGPLHRDGGCRGCERETDGAYRTYRRALAAEDEANEAYGEPGWDGRRYTDEDRKRDDSTVARYERAWRLAERDAGTAANGCAQCGRLERGHSWGGWVAELTAGIPVDRWVKHDYEQPADSLRLLRMLARRDAADARLYRAVARRFEALGGVAG